VNRPDLLVLYVALGLLVWLTGGAVVGPLIARARRRQQQLEDVDEARDQQEAAR